MAVTTYLRDREDAEAGDRGYNEREYVARGSDDVADIIAQGLADIPGTLGGLSLLALHVYTCGVYVVEWSAAPWRVTERVVREVVEVDGRKVKVERTVESRTLGAEELAGHRVEGKCYLRKWVTR